MTNLLPTDGAGPAARRKRPAVKAIVPRRKGAVGTRHDDKRTAILRTAAQHNRANVGVYASVLQSGKVCRGDSCLLYTSDAADE